MKHSTPHLSFAIVVALAVLCPMRAQPCAMGMAINPLYVSFTSRELTAGMIGFDEYVNPSTPPKRYRKRTVAGNMSVTEYVQSAVCEMDSCATEAHISFTNGSTVYGGGPFSGTVHLTVLSETPTDVTFLVSGLSVKEGATEVGCWLNMSGQIRGNGGAVTFPRGTMFQVQIEIPYVYWTGVGPAVCVRAGATPASVDAWDIEEVYDKKTAVLSQVRHSTQRLYAGTVQSPIPGGNPVASGRPDLLYSPRISSYVGPLQPTYTAATVTRVERKTTGLQCVPGIQFGPSSMSAHGEVSESLSAEDTEEDAEERALATAVQGTSNIAFRTSRGNGFSWSSRTVKYEAKFNITCPGDYFVIVHYSVKPHNAPGEGSPRTLVVRQRFEAGLRTVSGTVDPKEKDSDYTITKVEAVVAPTCADNPPGGASFDIGSVRTWLSLGGSPGGFSSGGLLVDSANLTSSLSSPISLLPAIPDEAGFEAVRDSVGLLRQVKSPHTLADVVVLSGAAYEVRFYAPAHVGTQHPATRLFTPTGAPFVTYIFENPDAAQSVVNRLRVTERRGATSKITEYSYDGATATWTLSTGNGLRRESEVASVVGGDKIKTRIIRGADGVIVSKTALTYHQFPWGEEVIRDVRDPDGAALTTSYRFYESVPVTDPNYRRLEQRIDDGGWERFTYDSEGRVLKRLRPFLNAAPGTTNEALGRVTENIYESVADGDGDGVAEARTTTIERMLGQETSRSYRVDWSKPVVLGGETFQHRSDIVCLTAGAAWDATANLVTRSLRYAAGPFSGRTRRVINPDGTASFTTYSLAGDSGLTTTTLSGQTNGGLDGVVDGRRVVTLSNEVGQVIGETVTDIASALPLTSWSATEFDLIGRPTRLVYTDGTLVTRTYACCGLASERDRMGAVTSFTYDELGRRETVTRFGIGTKTVFDADGRVVSVVRVGTDGSTMTQQSLTYDLAGRLTEARDALGRRTRSVETDDAATGQTTRTTTHPDEGTEIEVSARDGSRLSVSGTAVAPQVFDYGVDATGVFVKSTAVGINASGQPTFTEWGRQYADLAGRPLKTEFADGASSRSFYNAQGQLARQVDPDGVTMLFGYNARGEQEVVAADLNVNNAIDPAGTDRLTKATSVVATKTDAGGTYTVVRTTTLLWEIDHADAPTTHSITEQTSDGFRAWQTNRGLTTRAVTTLDGSGGRSIVTTTPDGLKTIRVYLGDRLVANTVKTAGEVQIAATTYAYDAHGRLSAATDARNGATNFTYFADDKTHTVTSPDPDVAASGLGYDPQTTTYSYDNAGRVATITRPDEGVVTYTYWPTGAVRRTAGARTYPVEYTYDPQGRVGTLATWRDFAANAGKAVTTWNYDPARGFLSDKRYADGNGPSYTYKPSGRLQTRSWARLPASTTTYVYTAAGDLNLTDYSDATPDVSLIYDRAGRAKAITDGAGSRSLAYHSSGQLAGESYLSGMLAGLSIDRSFDALHRMSGVAVPSVVSAGYSYDAESRFDTVTFGQNTATYGYDANSSLVSSLTFRNAGATRLVTTRSYDRLSRLGSISSASSVGAAISHAYTYNAANQRTRVSREDSAAWHYGYDSLGQVTSGRKLLGTGVAAIGQDYAWAYDDIGNRRTAATNGATSNFVANELNQYAQRTVPGVIDVSGAADPLATVTIGVNGGVPQLATRQGEQFHRQVVVNNGTAAQNVQLAITGVRNLAGPAGEDAVTALNQSVLVPQSPESFTHDADGNLIDDAEWHYTWDGENRLVAMESSATSAAAGALRRRLEFHYDGGSRRIAKKVSNWNGTAWTLASHTFFLYDGWNMIAELNALSSNAAVRTYVWGADLSGSIHGAGGVGGLLAINDGASSTTHLPAFDGNGNVVGLLQASDAKLTARYDYTAFGETTQREGAFAPGNPFGFSTKYTDFETGHLYYGYRCYVPETGRWLSRDPIAEEGGANLYGFVENAPTVRADPTGLAFFAFDGTNNDGYRDSKKGKETNVFILHSLSNDPNRRYTPGAGTNDGIFNFLGLAFGAGGRGRVNKMLGYADEIIKNGDVIFDIVGYSRGAVEARDFANKLKKKYPCVFIRWMGLFDSVASMGLPNNVNLGYKLGIPDGTGSVLHLVAGAERRAQTFALTSIHPGPDQSASNPHYREIVIPSAVHSDVGGNVGFVGRELANQSLLGMWQDGKNHGVGFDPIPSKYGDLRMTKPRDSRWLTDKVIEALTGNERKREIYYP